jgi:TetR/AcrR family transcriptional regulator, cholesterol catabolism regulator
MVWQNELGGSTDANLDSPGGRKYSNYRTNVRTELTVFMPKTSAPQREPQEKLQVILRHAAHVFCEKGYEGASIRDISRSSGVSLAGLYHYIKSKQELLYLIQIHTFKTIVARLEKSLIGVTQPEEKLRILVHNHLDYFLRHPVEMKVLAHEDEALEGAFRKEVLEVKRRYVEIALDIFEEMRRTGTARRLNPRVAVLSLFGMMNWTYTWHRAEIDPQADALAETIAGMFLHGVMNGHGDARSKSARPAVARLRNRRARADNL